MIRSLCYVGAALLWFMSASVTLADITIPPLQSRVTDLAGLLTPSQRQSLEQDLREFEARKGSQIAVLVVSSTQPETIEQYSLRVAETWKLGRKGVDDGVLLLVAKDDRELRIEVGYGLEGVIPDAIAKRIIAEIIAPYFKQGDYYGGIEAGVNRMIRLIEGEPLPPLSQKDTSWFDHYGQIAFVAAIIGGGWLRALFGRMVGALLASGTVTLLGWGVLGSLFAGAIMGLIVFLFVLAGGATGRFGGLSGGVSSGGGGFSGGGGGFGGGGASGSW